MIRPSEKLKIWLLSACALALAAPAAAQDGGRLAPRIDTGLRLGTERGIVTTEIWIPVRQDRDRVLYGDVRLSGDDRDNFEGNLGGGYRHIYGNTIFGAHGWIDRRKTERDSTFHQATLGVEALGRDFDARVNGYISLSDGKTRQTPNTGSATPYLAGSGIFYDTAGTLVEEPQGGFDIELGYRLPVFEDRIDSIRVYAGGYHFSGDETDDVTGWRTRVSADVTSWLQIGARFQKDGERGSQGFLEATLRFPGKASFRREGLRARLDESPERDIDIVTGAKITDSGLARPVLNESGDAQRVLHVDNTNDGAGTGTKEDPFSTLQAAQTEMRQNDVIYVHRGDGTTAGQDGGIVLDKTGVSLIGSGSDFVYDGNKFRAGQSNFSGFVLAAAGAAPVITNATANNGGDGVFITAGDTLVAGLDITGAQHHAIRVGPSAGQSSIGDVRIQSVNALNSGASGIAIAALSGQTISSVAISDTSSLNSTGNGFNLTASGGSIGHISINDSVSSGSTVVGVYFAAQNAGTIGRAEINDSTISGSTNNGLRFEATGAGSRINEARASGVSVTSSGNQGIWAVAQTSGQIDSIDLRDITANTNTLQGIRITAQTSGQIGSVALQDITALSNSQYGVRVDASSATISSVSIADVTAANNTQYGVFLQAAAAGHITTADISGISAHGNSGDGLRIEASGIGAQITDVNVSDVISQNNTGASGRGLLLYANTSGQIGTATLSDIYLSGNAAMGMWVYALSAGQITDLTLEDVTGVSNAGEGIRVEANGAGSALTSATISGATIQNSTGGAGRGVYVVTQNSGLISATDLQDITATGNSQQGVLVQSLSGGDITLATLQNISVANSATDGVRVEANGAGSTIVTANVSGVTSQNNTGASGRGVVAIVQNSGEIGMADFQDIVSTGNSQHGIYLVGLTNGILSASLEHATATGNASNGVFVDDDTAGAFTADLGGGAFGSAGDNRIFSNTGTELRVDLDGGQLKAENNWWGVGTGLAGGETTLDAASTVDANPFLAADPGL